jgi:hypothetical protein
LLRNDWIRERPALYATIAKTGRLNGVISGSLKQIYACAQQAFAITHITGMHHAHVTGGQRVGENAHPGAALLPATAGKEYEQVAVI